MANTWYTHLFEINTIEMGKVKIPKIGDLTMIFSNIAKQKYLSMFRCNLMLALGVTDIRLMHPPTSVPTPEFDDLNSKYHQHV